MPSPVTTINGQTFNWSRIAFAGGSHVVSDQRCSPGISRCTTRHRMGAPELDAHDGDVLASSVTPNFYVESITQGRSSRTRC